MDEELTAEVITEGTVVRGAESTLVTVTEAEMSNVALESAMAAFGFTSPPTVLTTGGIGGTIVLVAIG